MNSGDKRIAGLRAASMAASGRQDEQATTPEPQPGIQGEGGIGCREGRADAGERFLSVALDKPVSSAVERAGLLPSAKR